MRPKRGHGEVFGLEPADLFKRCQAAGLRVVAFEDGFLGEPDRFVQRVVAVRPAGDACAMRRSDISNSAFSGYFPFGHPQRS